MGIDKVNLDDLKWAESATQTEEKKSGFINRAVKGIALCAIGSAVLYYTARFGDNPKRLAEFVRSTFAPEFVNKIFNAAFRFDQIVQGTQVAVLHTLDETFRASLRGMAAGIRCGKETAEAVSQFVQNTIIPFGYDTKEMVAEGFVKTTDNLIFVSSLICDKLTDFIALSQSNISEFGAFLQNNANAMAESMKQGSHSLLNMAKPYVNTAVGTANSMGNGIHEYFAQCIETEFKI